MDATRPNSVAYTSTKHAIPRLTRTLALDGREFDMLKFRSMTGTPTTRRFVPPPTRAATGWRR